MRSLGAVALLILATLSECLCAQSDRSRSRSRSVPVAANIKREVDFDCPEEFGYYPHPTDCTLYYVCVFGGALLESCTGGLMYSHELQTCDWPRNVGCDGTSAIGGEELERFSERDPPPPPPPPRRAPPPPPRAQPNPVITSRGQPKFNRQEYEKQQQLYAEVDDLPPVEEIETDRQQRVYRGQPPTIGQVQKDRDGYVAQPISSGRTLNSNIIPASLSQNSKLGSFSFGSQVDDRRTATVTPVPQSYSEDQSNNVTDSLHDRQLDIETNEIATNDIIEKHSRTKRDTIGNDLGGNKTTSNSDEISNRNDSGEEMEYIEVDNEDEINIDDTERGKRQVRYYLKNGYKTNGKTWALAKPANIIDFRRPKFSNNGQNNRPQQSYNHFNRNNYYETTGHPHSAIPNNYYSTANAFLSYQIENAPSQTPFKPSLPDPSTQKQAHDPLNAATQIITKSPPISAISNNGNLFSSLSGGFYNNAPNNNQYVNQPSFNPAMNRPQNHISFQDSSQLPSTVVTGKPIKMQNFPRTQEQSPESNRNVHRPQKPTKQKNLKNPPTKSKEYDEEESSYSEEQSSEENDDEENGDYGREFADPPYDFKYPSNKFKDIVNPFANPDFDFDSYLYKISGGDYSSGSSRNIQKPTPVFSSTATPTTASQLHNIPISTVNYEGMSSPKSFHFLSGPGSSTTRPIINNISPSNSPSAYERLNAGSVSTVSPVTNSNRPLLLTVHQSSKYENENSGSHNPSQQTPQKTLDNSQQIARYETSQYKPGSTALPTASSIKPSVVPLQQRPQVEQTLSGPSSTILPIENSIRPLQYRPQFEQVSYELVSTSAPKVTSQRHRPDYEQTSPGPKSTASPVGSTTMQSYNPIKPNSQYEQFLSLSQSAVIPTGSSLRPSIIPLKQNGHYQQLQSRPEDIGIISTIKPTLSQEFLRATANYNKYQQSLYNAGSTVVPEININPSIATMSQAKYEKNNQPARQPLQQEESLNNIQRPFEQTASVSYESIRPKLKPPNFNDDRQLPISYSFLQPIDSSAKPNLNGNLKNQIQQVISVTGKPYNVFLTGTNAPLSVSSQRNVNIISDSPHFVSTGEPYSISSANPQKTYAIVKHSTEKPLSTLANEQLTALRQFWNGNPTQPSFLQSVTLKPAIPSNIPNLENLFSQIVKSTQLPYKNQMNAFPTLGSNPEPTIQTSTAKPSPKRRPIPKPSPEMNDYYYDDEDEQYYNEPAVKPKYMPSTEIKPKRPIMAQNDKEYDESYEDDDDDDDDEYNQSLPINRRPSQTTRLPVGFSTRKPESVTKNHNDVSISTKAPLKNSDKNIGAKIPIPVFVDYASPSPISFLQPELSAYKVKPHDPRNKTIHLRKPVVEGPNTSKPPKYLNQTTLRPYTVRHRLAKPTTVKESFQEEDKQTRGKTRHPNIVAQMISTTPRDSYNQETRYTKTKHDDTSNSLEPTESIAPSSYSASPRPKMLYNATQNYSPEQYDPFYAVYDEDGELYKDTDYVQQYNTASLRPAVQQTYRGTPPPARRPVETYTPRPLPDDYDDALIQGQIKNQNQYQTPIRHSTRGEGNELGYDHNPSSVKTTLYEATTKSTTPPTTSTSTTTTTKRPTTAPYTEAIIPSRNTPRSPTDENPIPESSSDKPSDDNTSSSLTTSLPIINLSSLAKPFEKTDNSHRLEETISTTKNLQTARRPSKVTNNNVELVRSKPSTNNKKVVSVTSGFSIRRNINNTNNPYTLTVLTRPFDDYNNTRRSNSRESNNRGAQTNRYHTDKNSSEASAEPVGPDRKYERSSERSTRRKDIIQEVEDDYDIPVYVQPTSRTKIPNLRTKSTTTTESSFETTTKSYVVNPTTHRRTTYLNNNQYIVDSTENSINNRIILNNSLENDKSNKTTSLPSNYTGKLEQHSRRDHIEQQNIVQETASIISPYKSLDHLRNTYQIDNTLLNQTTSTAASFNTPVTTTTRKSIRIRNPNKMARTKPSYYSYRLEEDDVPDQTTEVFNGKIKTVIKTFLSTFPSTTLPEIVEELPSTAATIKYTTPVHRNDDRVVNIGHQRKNIKYTDENPIRSNVQRLKIIADPIVGTRVTPSLETLSLGDQEDLPSLTTTMTTMGSRPFVFASFPTTPISIQSSTKGFGIATMQNSYQSKFMDLLTIKPVSEITQKFKKMLGSISEPDNSHLNNEPNNSLKTDITDINTTTTTQSIAPSKVESDVASTTSTTKATTTLKIESTTSTTKSISFPTRASRVNPAIKLAASNSGSGRRSYQSSSKCSSDNSLQANPKCNEIKYQRPTSTRGRGSAHYSKTSGSESSASQPAPNRGTPPTRSRPTLKPSTAIISETTKFVDIYASPPNRPAPVYPQPTPDKTAAKCRKDVCLLPDCYCGGKDIPGDMPVEQVPQIVLLTFDDSVNDLNKGLYSDLFEKGRVNPNGCPITATFYVSHEWTDYSQVQNLYSVGHEMASHTVSHSFGEQFSQKKWNREVGGQREILAAYGGVKLEDVRGMRAPFLSVGGNNMFKMLYESNFTYDSSLPVYENKPPSWPYTLDYKIFHDCMIPPCPTKSYPGVWEVPMVMWQDLNGGRCSMGDACANPPEPENVYKMILKNFDRHYTSNRAPFGLFYHAAWFTQPHHKEGFIMFLDFINKLPDVWIVTNWQALQWVRDPTPNSRINNFQPFQCDYQDRPKKCNNPKVCNLWHKSGVRYMRTCQPCPEVYPWTGKSGIRSSRIDNNGE